MNLGLGIGPTFIGPAFLWSPSRLRVGTRVVQDFTVRPNRLYSNLLGTTPIAGPGAEVAAMRDSWGVMVLTQTTAAARLKYAVQPAVGVRNRANGSAAVADAAFWFATVTNNGVTATKLSSGVTPDGNAWARYNVAGTATGSAFTLFYDAAQSRTPASAGQSWTASALMRVESGTPGGATSGLRVEAVEETAPGTFVGSTISSVFRGTESTTLSATRAMTTGNQVRTGIIYRVENGDTVDCIVYVEALQFELGTSRTAWQANLSEFDVTQAGQMSIHQLAFDGVDDFMSLASNFAPAGAYTMAAVRTGSSFPGGVTFDNAAGTATLVQSGSTQMTANTLSNQAQFNPAAWPSGAAGVRRLDMVRVTAADAAQAWRNGVLATTGITITGNLVPLSAISRLGRAGSSGRFNGGLLLDEGDTPLTEAERLLTERYLAYNGGITL